MLAGGALSSRRIVLTLSAPSAPVSASRGVTSAVSIARACSTSNVRSATARRTGSRIFVGSIGSAAVICLGSLSS